MGLRSFLKTHWHKGVWQKVQIVGFVLLIAIILFEGLFFAGVWYNSLQSGLTVYIQPEQPIITTQGPGFYDATFLVGVTNAPFCTEQCAYTITDQRTGERFTGTIHDPQETLTPITHTLQAPQRGQYTSAAQFTLTCTNQPTTRCQRPHDSATQTSTVRVEHARVSEQEDAYQSIQQSWEDTQERLGGQLSTLLGIIDVEDVRANNTRRAAIEELSILQERIRALQTAVSNEELVLAVTLAEPLTLRAPDEYQELVTDEERAVEAYAQLREVLPAHTEQLPFISTENYTSQRRAYQRAQQAATTFMQTPPEVAYEEFLLATATPETNLSLAERMQTIVFEEQALLCAQNITTCPQPIITAENVSVARAALMTSCAQRQALEQVYAANNQTRTPHPDEEALCGLLQRSLPSLPESLTQILPQQPMITAHVRIPLPQAQCCALGRCVACGKEVRAPILFVHGHSFAERTAPEYSLQAFSVMALALEEEGWLHAGAVFPREHVQQGMFAHSPGGVSFTTTYYYDGFAEEGEVRFVTRKTERIETYAIRLRESIQNVKTLTGQDEVIIVAHSMGGLVTRSYLEIFGEEDVAGVIMIGTPNSGIPRLIERICPIIGADFECEDMRTNSLYLRRLAQAPAPSIPVLTIAGEGCDGAFDGVVEVDSVALPYATNLVINGSCPTQDNLLHNRMLYPEEYPEVYMLIKQFLNNPEASMQE